MVMRLYWIYNPGHFKDSAFRLIKIHSPFLAPLLYSIKVTLKTVHVLCRPYGTITFGVVGIQCDRC